QDVWSNRVPEKVAELKGIDILEAKKYCFQMYEKYRGTIYWSDIYHWSDQFGFDILSLYDDVKIYPDAIRLLERIEKNRHKAIVVTASFPEINIKKTLPIKNYVYKIYTILDFKTTKEYPAFFSGVLDSLGAKPEDCIFVDDLIKNVLSAREAGIKSYWLWRKEEMNEIELNDMKKYSTEPHITSLDQLDVPDST
ncbi:MAG: HAD-IA family hydrolase, partial [Thermoplasmata archaeon]